MNLTPANSSQEKVEINLFLYSDQNDAYCCKIGSMVLKNHQNIPPDNSGTDSQSGEIILQVGFTEENILTVDIDPDNSTKSYSFMISWDQIDDACRQITYHIPGTDNELPEIRWEDSEQGDEEFDIASHREAKEYTQPRKTSVLAIISYLMYFGAVGYLVYFLLQETFWN